MCGRCACTRGPGGMSRACAYRNRQDVVTEPQWVLGGDQGYWPSYNICPQTCTPVLVSAKQGHLTDCGCHGDSDRVLQTMRWGLVPGWHKGDLSGFPSLLNNCRAETMRQKPSFRSAISKGQRCVVLADGFYEWQTSKPGKQPYFITFEDDAPTKETVSLCGTLKESDLDESTRTSPFRDKRLLTMAGYFDIWNGDGENHYTYTVITVEANTPFADIHHRIPAILDGNDAISEWLDFERVPIDQAAQLVQPVANLKWYPVSSTVNNSRNKSPVCVKEIDPSKPELPPSQPSLFKWMTKSPKKQPRPLDDQSAGTTPPTKKEKM